MTLQRLSAMALACAAISAFATEAWSGSANRAWVSGHGVDEAGCGSPASPCRSLQYTHDNIVAAGAEIDILDPAGYGAITVTKALSIVNDGVGTAGVQATAGAAITINTGPSDTVYLRGLNIDGVNGSAKYGVDDQSAGKVTIDNCVIRHFKYHGVYLEPAAGFPKVNISNTTVSDNEIDAINYHPLANTATQLDLDHVSLNDNYGGILALFVSGNLAMSVTNSQISNNSFNGVDLDSPTIVAMIDNTQIDLNSQQGIQVYQATVHLSRSDVFLNGQFGINNDPFFPGTIYSTGDNRMGGNLSGPITGPALVFEGAE